MASGSRAVPHYGASTRYLTGEHVMRSVVVLVAVAIGLLVPSTAMAAKVYEG
jgi:hypothetical protein